MSAVVAINAAAALVQLTLEAATAIQKYAQIQQRASDLGRPVSLDDLKEARAADDVAAAQLDATIAAHEAALAPSSVRYAPPHEGA